MKITHCAHRDKWGYSINPLVSGLRRAIFHPQPEGCVDPFFRGMKGLAYDMFNYA
jgi:hypothetical protein